MIFIDTVLPLYCATINFKIFLNIPITNRNTKKQKNYPGLTLFRNDKPRAFWEMSGFDGMSNFLCPQLGKKILKITISIIQGFGFFFFQQFVKFSLKESLKGHFLVQDLQTAQSSLKAPFRVWNASWPWFLVSSNVLPASTLHLHFNAKSAWWQLTYYLFKIAGRSQRRPFLKTTVRLKPQMAL